MEATPKLKPITPRTITVIPMASSDLNVHVVCLSVPCSTDVNPLLDVTVVGVLWAGAITGDAVILSTLWFLTVLRNETTLC